MNQRLKSAVTLLAALCAISAAPAASAQSAGQFTAKFGAGRITPKVESGDVSAPAMPGSKVAIASDTEPVLIFAYGLTDNISTEVALGLPYKHKLYGAGSIAGTGQLGTVEALPPTVFVQYRFFEPETMVRPYVGLGLTYAYFQKATGSGQLTAILNTGGAPATFKIDGKAAGTLQAGVAVNLNPKWFVDATVTKTFLKVKNTYSTGQTQDVKLDPLGVILAVGYKF
ncbi:OmpW family outer membrane protein [Massilia sp. R2A-15]|uniref:OmpW/AlkL family protein n=1 Tax=Massilia sp. R2A-15 TaxID=3064278 RepID=UPI002734E43A|nr:OmpW family outer membrane protein [Massilia sp. R2A-15]WLI88574.1 OmpW family outer membrane protein [Massilia sp. R2A-15]